MQVCGMEMRPAKGRADIILGRERFRCSRCGAKAAAYFNIDNMEDPRAVARSVETNSARSNSHEVLFHDLFLIFC
jgi:hypothetical protein